MRAENRGEHSEETVQCLACREPIQSKASLCPHCRTAQHPSKWIFVGNILKWAGGGTVILSLLVTVVQVNSLFKSWQERQKNVEEWVKGANFQADSGDFSGAWTLYEQALTLEPGAQYARSGQVQLAMSWLRHIRVQNEETFTGIVVKILPVLYRGAASSKAGETADIISHIGWANFLRHREGHTSLKVEEHFAKALEIDPSNVYAHTMWGFWILWESGPLDSAKQHFSIALESGRDRAYVREYQLTALHNSIYHNLGETTYRHQVADELIHTLNDIRKNQEPVSPSVRIIGDLFSRTYYSIPWFERWLQNPAATLPAEDHLATFLLLKNLNAARMKYQQLSDQFWEAYLRERSGDTQNALKGYRALQSELETSVISQSIIGVLREKNILNEAITRLSSQN